MIDWIILLAPALVLGSILSFLAAPLGCIVLWRQMAFFSDTLAHGALLGVALAFLLSLPLWSGLLIMSAIVVVLLWLIYDEKLPNDALLSGISASLLALGMIFISKTAGLRSSMSAYLFGDLLTLTWQQVPFYIFICVLALFALVTLWHKQVAISISHDLASVSGVNIRQQQFIFMMILAGFTAVAIQAVGSLLVSSLLILPALSARLLSHSPKQMLLWSIVVGQVCLFTGMASSVYFDIASGLAVVLALGVVFLCVFSLQKLANKN